MDRRLPVPIFYIICQQKKTQHVEITLQQSGSKKKHKEYQVECLMQVEQRRKDEKKDFSKKKYH